jgi:hypothetical protein
MALVDATILLRLRDYVNVAHHIPGRIRLRIMPGLRHDPQALELARTMDLDSWGNGDGWPAIINTRLNLKGGSLVVEYDPEMVPPEMITELFSSRDADRVKQLTEQLAELFGLKF